MATKNSPKGKSVKKAKPKTFSPVKKSTKEKLLKDLGRRLILEENYVTGSAPAETAYSVIVYYNGAVNPIP